MNQRPPETSAAGDAELEPDGVDANVGSASTPPVTSTIEHAVSALGDLLNLAFDDARRIDQYGRQLARAFGDIDCEHRVLLGDRHPALVEALLLLENHLDRIDRR